jgi:hypothetical protein
VLILFSGTGTIALFILPYARNMPQFYIFLCSGYEYRHAIGCDKWKYYKYSEPTIVARELQQIKYQL